MEEPRDTREAQYKHKTSCHTGHEGLVLILQDHKIFVHVISELFICRSVIDTGFIFKMFKRN